MSQHTPGPWALDDKTGSLTWGDVSFGAPVGAGGFVVASHSVVCIPRHQAERLTDEHRANGRVIVAAPAMLAALKGLVEVADKRSRVYAAAVEAIAQAEGRT